MSLTTIIYRGGQAPRLAPGSCLLSVASLRSASLHAPSRAKLLIIEPSPATVSNFNRPRLFGSAGEIRGPVAGLLSLKLQSFSLGLLQRLFHLSRFDSPSPRYPLRFSFSRRPSFFPLPRPGVPAICYSSTAHSLLVFIVNRALCNCPASELASTSRRPRGKGSRQLRALKDIS